MMSSATNGIAMMSSTTNGVVMMSSTTNGVAMMSSTTNGVVASLGRLPLSVFKLSLCVQTLISVTSLLSTTHKYVH